MKTLDAPLSRKGEGLADRKAGYSPVGERDAGNEGRVEMNPWQRQEIRRARNFQARDQFNRPTEALDLDSAYNDPRYRETRECPQGHRAYRKASVGTFVCPTCGSLQAANGQWTPPKY